MASQSMTSWQRSVAELGIEFKEPSIAMALTYRTGEWLYDEHGSRLDTRLRRWGTGVERIVKGHFGSRRVEASILSALKEICAWR